MPVQDWSAVRAGWFHHFHNSWIYKLTDRLNAGLLPPGFYSAGEQVVGGADPDVLTLEERSSPGLEAEEAIYLRKQDRVVIRRSGSDRIVALIEIVSRGNKESRNEFERFLRKVSLTARFGWSTMGLMPKSSESWRRQESRRKT